MREHLWQRAASFAARAHAGQVRKDGVTPYFAHPVRVAMIVREVFGCDDEVALAAAFLHDTIEDTRTDYDDLLGAFGPRVADCVGTDFFRMGHGKDWTKTIRYSIVVKNHTAADFRPPRPGRSP